VETPRGAGSRLGELSGEGTHVWGSGDSWDPLWLLADEVITAARDRYGHSAERPVLLADGLWNQSWRLSTPDGAFVLRVIRPDLDVDQIRYEHETTARLQVQIAEAVVPLPGVDGDTVQHWGELLVVLFPFIAGTTAASLPAPLWERQAARILGRIHRAGVLADLQQRPGASRVDEQPTIWSTLGPMLWDCLDRNEETVDLLRGIDTEAATLDRWSTEAMAPQVLTIGAVHGDFNPRNLLVDDHRIVAVLDWETVQLDAQIVDLADVLLAADRPAEYWRAYREAGGPVEESELELVPGLARRQALLELQFAVDGAGRAKPQALRKLREVTAALRTLPTADDSGWRLTT
jgi:Ser/Thr protein kinase RdoA (MazF antagonist)